MITLDGKTPRYGWKWEQASARAHYDKWEQIAQGIGIESLRRLMPATEERIIEAFGGDRVLNNIPLGKWDAQDYAVRGLAVRAGWRSWSLSDTVCVLKHVAQYYVAHAPIPQEFTDADAKEDAHREGASTGYNFWCSECFNTVFGFRAQHTEHKRGVYSPQKSA